MLDQEEVSRSEPSERIDDYKESLITFMKQLDELEEITDDDYFDNLMENGPADLKALYAASLMDRWNIKVFDYEAKTSFEYSVDSATQTIDMVVLGSFFGVKIMPENLID